MMFYCFIASITQEVMDKVILKKSLYALQARGKAAQDGIYFLKVIIDSYYANTRTTTIEIRKQLANLPAYAECGKRRCNKTMPTCKNIKCRT
jgi:hypothetical protein